MKNSGQTFYRSFTIHTYIIYCVMKSVKIFYGCSCWRCTSSVYDYVHLNVHGKIPSRKIKPQWQQMNYYYSKIAWKLRIECGFWPEQMFFLCCCVRKMGSEWLPPAYLVCFTCSIVACYMFDQYNFFFFVWYYRIEQFSSTYFIDFILAKMEYSIAKTRNCTMYISSIFVVWPLVFGYGVWQWHMTLFPLGTNQ